MVHLWLQTGYVFENVHDVAVLIDDKLLVRGFALVARGAHEHQFGLVLGIAAVFGQFLQHVGSGLTSYVQVMGQSGSVRARTRERMFLGRLGYCTLHFNYFGQLFRAKCRPRSKVLNAPSVLVRVMIVSKSTLHALPIFSTDSELFMG